MRLTCPLNGIGEVFLMRTQQLKCRFEPSPQAFNVTRGIEYRAHTLPGSIFSQEGTELSTMLTDPTKTRSLAGASPYVAVLGQAVVACAPLNQSQMIFQLEYFRDLREAHHPGQGGYSLRAVRFLGFDFELEH
jgi:hypothetical protein